MARSRHANITALRFDKAFSDTLFATGMSDASDYCHMLQDDPMALAVLLRGKEATDGG